MVQANKSLKEIKKTKLLLVILSLFISISAGFIGGWLGAKSFSHQNGAISMTPQELIVAESDVVTTIAENVSPSVVSIEVESQGRTRSLFGFGEPFTRQSAGTGFILNKDGIILTNRHVVPEGISSVSITLSDGTTFDDVEVLGRTAASDPLDIAFLKVKDTQGVDLVPVKLGSSASMKVGQRVVAIGNALGEFQNTVTTGIISGFGRSIAAGDASSVDTLQNLFQTDAAINQGNSGGPLVNSKGEVIGVNTAVAGGGAENIGFAIPIDDIKGLISSVLEKGVFERPYLGVRYIPLTEQIAEELDVDQNNGALLVEGSNGQGAIAEGSPADKAGLQVDDVITKVDGQAIDENNSLVTLVGRRQVGEEITLTIVRDGEEQQVKVVLEAAPEN